MIGTPFIGTFTNTAATAARDVFELVPPSDEVAVLTGLAIGQTTDVGDAEDENLRLQIILGYTTSGTGGSSVTPDGPFTYGGTMEALNTTLATTGTPRILLEMPFNVRAGALWIPSEHAAIIVPPSVRAVVRIPDAPADSITFSGELRFNAIG